MTYWSRSFLGLAECLTEVRKFTAAVLGDGPGTELVVLAVSELAANAILHTASGEPGGQFVVHLATYSDRWQVRVDDAGGPKEPRVCHAESHDAEAGRGLALVAALSCEWGVIGDEYARAVWAEFLHPPDEEEAGFAEELGGVLGGVLGVFGDIDGFDGFDGLDDVNGVDVLGEADGLDGVDVDGHHIGGGTLVAPEEAGDGR